MPIEDEPSFYRKLIRRGVSHLEIERLYKKLRDKGYGEEEPSKKAFQERVKELKDGRSGPDRRRKRKTSAGNPEQSFDEGAIVDIHLQEGIPAGEFWRDTETFKRRAEDLLPRISPSLRRRIDAWAFRNGLLMVGLKERLLDFFTHFYPYIKDCPSGEFLRTIIPRTGFRSGDPRGLGIPDTLEALHITSRFFLGKERRGTSYVTRARTVEIERSVQETLKRRDRFGFEFLMTFSVIDDKLDRSVEFIENALAKREAVEYPSLVRVVKQLYRYRTLTERVGRDEIRNILAVAKDVNLAFDRSSRLKEELDSAETLFTVLFARLESLSRECYPALMRMINGFYEIEDRSEAKLYALYEFLEIKEEAILDYNKYRRQEEKLKEKALAERTAQEETLPAEEPSTVESFAKRFASILDTLGILFPDSRIDEPDEYPYLLPYFDRYVFRSNLVFSRRGRTAENLHRTDPMGQIMVFHRILDNLLSSLNEFNLEKILETPYLSESLLSIKQEWQEVYVRIFEPYLELLSRYVNETESSESGFLTLGTGLRSIEHELLQLRGACIKDYATEPAQRGFTPPLKLYPLAERLHDLLSGIGLQLNREIVRAESALSQKIYAELGDRPIVDFKLHADPGTVEFKPTTRQVKRYIEAKYRCAIDGMPKLAQIHFFEIFRETSALYRYLLTEENSFYRSTVNRYPLAAGGEERALWKRVASSPETDPTEIQHSAFSDFRNPEYIDALTGFWNKNFFLKELPRRVRKLVKTAGPVTLLMTDIDHFKWINDELGHQVGDAVIKRTAELVSSLLDRERDIAVRFGGEEFLLILGVPPAEGISEAERLRAAQESSVAAFEPAGRIAQIAETHGGPCGTLSVGAVGLDSGITFETAVERADRMLYEAKRRRNSVAVEPPHGPNDREDNWP
jgi:diguanylate cyclase (GGDEF)-like protein